MRNMSTMKRPNASQLIILMIAMFMIGLSVQSVSASGCPVDPTLAWVREVTARSTKTAVKTINVPPASRKIKTHTTSDDPIDLGKQYFSKEDLDQVMEWIGVQVSSDRLPFCWKESKTRGAGVPITECPSGTEKDGELCYSSCKDGYKGAGPVCWQSCPSGFTDIGAFCQKPAPYGRGVGYVLWEEQKCKDENSQGCEQNGALWYPKCKSGFHAVGSNICSPDCPEGFADSGTGCTKPSYGRGAGTTLTCREGLEKSGLLCYEPCASGSNGVGPVCWSQCPSNLPVDCAAGCAKDKATCALRIYDQVSSVAKASISLASLGGESVVLKNLDKMTEIFDNVKETAERSHGQVPLMIGKDTSLEEVQKITPMGGGYSKVGTEIGEKIINYANLFSDDFETLTTPEVAKEIDSKFSAGAAAQIKREWGIRHLALTLQMNGFTAAKDLLWLASFGDPSGLSAVANAFLHPVCASETPFPDVTELK